MQTEFSYSIGRTCALKARQQLIPTELTCVKTVPVSTLRHRLSGVDPVSD